jgi:hypothetical protein
VPPNAALYANRKIGGKEWRIGRIIAIAEIKSESVAVRDEPQRSLFSNLP